MKGAPETNVTLLEVKEEKEKTRQETTNKRDDSLKRKELTLTSLKITAYFLVDLLFVGIKPLGWEGFLLFCGVK